MPGGPGLVPQVRPSVGLTWGHCSRHQETQRLSCQGTTSVVPNLNRIEEGFSPRLWQNHPVHLIRKT